jgi:hypothetical protein
MVKTKKKEKLICDFCKKPAKYIFSTRIVSTLWDLKGDRINEFEDDEQDKQYCKEHAEEEGIL